MLLAYDIGNTNMVIGLYNGKKLINHWRIATDRQKTGDEYGLLLEGLFRHHKIQLNDLDQAIISSVVPNLTGTIKEMIEKYVKVKPLIVGAGIKTGMVIRYENPKEVGADRIVNAVAGIEKYGAPLVLVDFGTATTFCAINAQGEYIGGAIAPGIGIAANALIEKTSQLPRVELVMPKNVIGRNTVNAIQSGLLYGYCGLVDGLVKRFIVELGFEKDQVRVVGTGGLADVIQPHSETIECVDQLLTLEGLRILFEKNQ